MKEAGGVSERLRGIMTCGSERCSYQQQRFDPERTDRIAESRRQLQE